jgi:hypothetical protein
MLIFVFTRISCGLRGAILAEFVAVPNAPSDVDPTPESALRTVTVAVPQAAPPVPEVRPVEIGGPQGPEPTRYGDWERNGRCVDF